MNGWRILYMKTRVLVERLKLVPPDSEPVSHRHIGRKQSTYLTSYYQKSWFWLILVVWNLRFKTNAKCHLDMQWHKVLQHQNEVIFVKLEKKLAQLPYWIFFMLFANNQLTLSKFFSCLNILLTVQLNMLGF